MRQKEKRVLLSFDIEEFEMPGEYGKPIPFEQQISVSREGTVRILDTLSKFDVKATFYTTVNFARHNTDLIQRIVKEEHELASHGWVHDHFEVEHLKMSRLALEEIGGVRVNGYRMARMQYVPEKEVFTAGYTYNSSINPTYLPGRYNYLKESRTYFVREKVIQLPASVTPMFRIPLFWLSFHNFPMWMYKCLANRILNKDGYLNIYFHPWEFMDIGPKEKYNFPFYVIRNTNEKMIVRLSKFISDLKKRGIKFSRTIDFIESLNIE